MIAARTSTKAVAAAARPARVLAPLRARVAGARPGAVVRSQSESQSDAGSEFSAKAQEAFNDASKFVKETWETTADAEKPAIIGILGAVVFLQIAIAACMDKIDKIPVLGDFFELVGVTVVGVYAYKLVTNPAQRADVQDTVDGVVTKMTGNAKMAGSSSPKKPTPPPAAPKSAASPGAAAPKADPAAPKAMSS